MPSHPPADDTAAYLAALADIVHRRRIRLNWSQAKTARDAAVGKNFVWALERARHWPNLLLLIQLVDTLGLSLGELLTAAAAPAAPPESAKPRPVMIVHYGSERGQPAYAGRPVQRSGAGWWLDSNILGIRLRQWWGFEHLEPATNALLMAHWCTLVVSDPLGDPLAERVRVHPWSPPGHRPARLTFEVRREFCGVRWPRTPRLATGLCAIERRSVSDRQRCPGTTGCLPTGSTARRQR
jgi:transcriptional regulator with XRE-family HTH domain